MSLLYLDSQHYLWVGTYNMGVYRCHLERGTIDHFGIEQGLIHNSVCGVLEDKETGDFWISTVIGLSKLSMKDSRIVNYTKDTGFPLNEGFPEYSVTGRGWEDLCRWQQWYSRVCSRGNYRRSRETITCSTCIFRK